MSTILSSSRVVERVLTIFFGTKLSWLSNYILFMLKMNKAMILKHGVFSVRAEKYSWKRFDYKWRFDPPLLFFFHFCKLGR